MPCQSIPRHKHIFPKLVLAFTWNRLLVKYWRANLKFEEVLEHVDVVQRNDSEDVDALLCVFPSNEVLGRGTRLGVLALETNVYGQLADKVQRSTGSCVYSHAHSSPTVHMLVQHKRGGEGPTSGRRENGKPPCRRPDIDAAISLSLDELMREDLKRRERAKTWREERRKRRWRFADVLSWHWQKNAHPAKVVLRKVPRLKRRGECGKRRD
ncbi:hypothetical protein EI94DRAFT_1701944 [Lactarius quietus]|nr:hypothetical protein EI94DRAFT_1787976 [Lactarius quietus]KAF8266183.1 hypothetical protein EI94DRAFT_1701944 [Lactarius quietus]